MIQDRVPWSCAAHKCQKGIRSKIVCRCWRVYSFGKIVTLIRQTFNDAKIATTDPDYLQVDVLANWESIKPLTIWRKGQHLGDTTPMLQPSEAELRSIHKSTSTPFSNAPFDTIRAALLRWYVSRRLNAALSTYFENARSRIDVR